MSFIKLFTRDRPKALRHLENSSFKEVLLSETYACGWSCVHLTALDGDIESLRKLSSHNANLWTLDERNIFPIFIAVKESHYDIVAFILSKDIPAHVIRHMNDRLSLVSNTKDSTHDFFVNAFNLHNLDILRLLLDKFSYHLPFDFIKNLIECAFKHNNAYKIVKKVLSNHTFLISDQINNGVYLNEHLSYALKPNPKLVKWCTQFWKDNDVHNEISYRFAKTSNYVNGNNRVELFKILKYFIRYSGISKTISPISLYNVLTTENDLAVDIMIAAGCDPFQDHILLQHTCFYNTFLLGYQYQSNRKSRNLYISFIHKFLMYFGYRCILFKNQSIDINPNSKFVAFASEIFLDYYSSITLFDLLAYRTYIDDLKLKLWNY